MPRYPKIGGASRVYERAGLMSAEKAKHDRELELLRSDIRREAFQSEVRFTRLHEKRAEVIADLFTKLVALVDAAHQHLIGPRVKASSLLRPGNRVHEHICKRISEIRGEQAAKCETSFRYTAPHFKGMT